ncbi:phytanoyl-CoA dioxygenase family protein [Synechococcus sp. MIT S1220]|uniref:phytanoyl-CoA dioxygenase family protein n=1 Tax=Synechococcus sp. MIT S1220 TaxID=3082549 RepID=UPI0039B056C1
MDFIKIKQKFDSKGWIFKENLINESLIRDYKAKIQSIRSLQEFKIETLYFAKPHLRDLSILDILFTEIMISIINYLMDISWSVFNMNHFKRSTGYTMHRDTAFYFVQPTKMLGIWIALQDISYRQGPFFIIEESHKFPFDPLAKLIGPEDHLFMKKSNNYNINDLKLRSDLYHSRLFKRYANKNHKTKYFFPMRAGDVIFFDGSVFHGALNSTNQNIINQNRDSLVIHITHCDSEMYTPDRFLKDFMVDMNINPDQRINRIIKDHNGVKYDINFT